MRRTSFSSPCTLINPAALIISLIHTAALSEKPLILPVSRYVCAMLLMLFTAEQSPMFKEKTSNWNSFSSSHPPGRRRCIACSKNRSQSLMQLASIRPWIKSNRFPRSNGIVFQSQSTSCVYSVTFCGVGSKTGPVPMLMISAEENSAAKLGCPPARASTDAQHGPRAEDRSAK